MPVSLGIACLLRIACLLLLAASSAMSQGLTGQISGVVQDSAGAATSGAEAVVTNAGTGQSRPPRGVVGTPTAPSIRRRVPTRRGIT